MFAQTTGTMIAGGIYTILLAIAAVSDFRTRRIPNRVCLALLAGGIAYSVETLGAPRGLGFAIGGVIVGFTIWIPFYALRWLGAGDVKLVAAAGAWLGSIGALRASAVGAAVGGGLSLAVMLWQRSPKRVAADVLLLFNTIRRRPMSLRVRMDTTDQQLMPYGVALAVGALFAAWFNR
ncbi:MAG: type leader peptidase family protein [Gemmatimonadetes bacterium]|nr:type leader peptidase family protein [Gemmatimonadota bacterium]